jgi:hypothetical protein
VDLFDADPVPDPGERPRTLEERFNARISMAVPDRHNPRLRRLMEAVNKDDDLYALPSGLNPAAKILRPQTQ